jgi:molecular chaperone HtpG
MVSDRVEVITKKAGEDKAYKFVSDGSGEFEINEVIKDSHGTVVYMKLKDDAKEFLNPQRVKEIVKRYSNHIPYKIYLNYQEKIEGEDGVKVENKRELINDATALWTLPKNEIKDEEYIEFYKTTWGDFEEPLSWIHTIAEGTLEYKTLFYIPKKAPADIYRADFEPGVKLYVKRVFITDKEKELLPLYLRFVRGIIDSEDLPLNVSREILQENRILANIKQASTKRILNHIKKLDKEKFDIFINEYNKLIKEGIYTDLTNKELLLQIVRYKSSAVEGLTSLDEYIEREKGKEDRKEEIYYIIGDDEAVLRNSPLLEAYKKSNLEVLIMDDKEIDEVVTPSIGEYKNWKFVDVSMVEPPKSEEDKKELEELETKYKELTVKLKDILGDSVKDVKVTNRLSDSLSCVVPDSSDPMASMRHMFKMMGQDEPELPLILELNAKHPITEKLNSTKDEDFIKDTAHILLDSAKLAEGLEVKDRVNFAKRLTNLLNRAI